MTLVTSDLREVLMKQLRDYPSPATVDVISSYIRKEGLDGLWPVFETLALGNTKIRVMTTLQRKITDIESLERLARLKNTSVYIFWPEQVKFHAKGWLFMYKKDVYPVWHEHDTVIIGSSNITSMGVRVAVEWNLLLRRQHLPRINTDIGYVPNKPFIELSDTDKIIDQFKETFEKYIESPRYNRCLIQYRTDVPEFEDVKKRIEQFLLTDAELVEKKGSPAIQKKWEELQHEQDKIAKALRASVAPVLPETASKKIAEIEQEIQAKPRSEISGREQWFLWGYDQPKDELDSSIIKAVLTPDAPNNTMNEAETSEITLRLAEPYYT